MKSFFSKNLIFVNFLDLESEIDTKSNFLDQNKRIRIKLSLRKIKYFTG